MNDKEKMEIPFGAKDSELKGWEYTIPEGMEAVIENGKIIVKEKESDDEKIRKEILTHFELIKTQALYDRQDDRPEESDIVILSCNNAIAWLEKQKKLFESGRGLYYYDGEKLYFIGNPAMEDNPYDFAMRQQEEEKEQKQKVKDPFDDEQFRRGYEAGKNDARKEAEKSYGFQYPYYEPPCFHGGICTNPFRDCINCPRIGGVIGISTTSGTYKKD